MRTRRLQGEGSSSHSSRRTRHSGECHLGANVVCSALPSLPRAELDALVIENAPPPRVPGRVAGGRGRARDGLLGDRGRGQAAEAPLMFRTSDLAVINKVDSSTSTSASTDSSIGSPPCRRGACRPCGRWGTPALQRSASRCGLPAACLGHSAEGGSAPVPIVRLDPREDDAKVHKLLSEEERERCRGSIARRWPISWAPRWSGRFLGPFRECAGAGWGCPSHERGQTRPVCQQNGPPVRAGDLRRRPEQASRVQGAAARTGGEGAAQRPRSTQPARGAWDRAARVPAVGVGDDRDAEPAAAVRADGRARRGGDEPRTGDLDRGAELPRATPRRCCARRRRPSTS